jgi:hypothetical protein
MKQKFVQDDTNLKPNSFLIDKIELENHSGDVFQIAPITTSFQITENIILPSMILELTVFDAANFLENAPIIGQEKLRIKLSKTPPQAETQEINLEFFVTEYPQYTRSLSERAQTYTFRGISEHAYNSAFIKISRSYQDPTPDEIQKILVEDLKLPEEKFVVRGEDLSKSKGIITIQDPLSAIEFLRKNSFDQKLTPFFLFQTIDGNVNFVPLSLLTGPDNPVYETYLDFRSSFQAGGNTVDEASDYYSDKNRILELASNLGMSKYKQGIKGAFGSENNYLDLSSKTYDSFTYDYSQAGLENNSLEQKSAISTKFEILGQPINELVNANVEYIATNDQAFSEDINYGSNMKLNSYRNKAYEALINTFEHDIVLYGDFNLNPGVKIELKFPKSIDPEEVDADELYDESLSGKYLITSVQHLFKGGEYHSNIRVKRDTLAVEI